MYELTGKEEEAFSASSNLFLHLLDVRFRQFLGYDVLLEVVCNDHVVAVPDDFTDERVHEQLAHLDVVRIFKHFGEQDTSQRPLPSDAHRSFASPC